MSKHPGYIDSQGITADLRADAIDPANCTAIIPAAGRGSRLGSTLPKILFPIDGVSTLERLSAVLRPFCSTMVLVVSPASRDAVSAAAERICPGRFAIAEQTEPTGMFDAVACGFAAVSTPNTLVIWGDQAAVQSESLSLCFGLHYGVYEPGATMPTVVGASPYIHLKRNSEGAVVAVLQAREGDEMPETGESDCGVFLFRTSVLAAAMSQSDPGTGRRSGERNFLPILPVIERMSSILCVRISSAIEALGLNTPDDAERLARHFRGRRSEVSA